MRFREDAVGRKTMEFILKNELCSLDSLREKIEEFGDENGFPPKLVFKINLALDELTTNIISYGYEDEGEHDIHVKLSLKDQTLTLQLIDDGQPFDPLEAEAPDVSCPINERKVGGLGIHLVKEIMDSVHYARRDGKNMTTLVKSLNLNAA